MSINCEFMKQEGSRLAEECITQSTSADYALMKMSTQEELPYATNDLIWALEHGADVNKSIICGMSVIHTMKLRQHVEILIKHGADVNKKDAFGKVPLMRCDAEKAEILLKAGANVNVQDNNGLTPLMYATAKQDSALVRLFLAAGADIYVRNKDGDVVGSFAYGTNVRKIKGQGVGNLEIVEMFIAEWAKQDSSQHDETETAANSSDDVVADSSTPRSRLDAFADQIPEHIWIELILTNGMYEMFVPEDKCTALIQAVCQFMKNNRTEHDTRFRTVLAVLENGLSDEHKQWRTPLNELINAFQVPVRKIPGGTIRNMGRIK